MRYKLEIQGEESQSPAQARETVIQKIDRVKEQIEKGNLIGGDWDLKRVEE